MLKTIKLNAGKKVFFTTDNQGVIVKRYFEELSDILAEESLNKVLLTLKEIEDMLYGLSIEELTYNEDKKYIAGASKLYLHADKTEPELKSEFNELPQELEDIIYTNGILETQIKLNENGLTFISFNSLKGDKVIKKVQSKLYNYLLNCGKKTGEVITIDLMGGVKGL